MKPSVPFQDIHPANRLVEKSFLAEMRVLYREGAFSGGPRVAAFETSFARYLGAPHCLGVNSGTSAVHLALLALGVGPGDEVIVPAFTFVGSAWGILYCGAKPVFADVSPETFCIDPESAAAAVTPRTKALIAVHLFGRPADMRALRALARAQGLALIEDAAQAHGAMYRGKRLGTLGDLGCFSFYPSKNLGGCGEGGAVTTKSKALAATIAKLRNHGQRVRYRHEMVGYNYRMDGIQGLFLDQKLAHLDAMNARRRAVASAYRKGMRNPRIELPEADPESVWHLFVVRARKRERFLRHLEAQGIGYGVHYPQALPELPPFRPYAAAARCPHALQLAREAVSLPLYYGMTQAQIARVIEAVNAFR